MTDTKAIEAAERYLSRQPIHTRVSGKPLYEHKQMIRAFCAGEIAVIDHGDVVTPPPTATISRDLLPIAQRLIGWEDEFPSVKELDALIADARITVKAASAIPPPVHVAGSQAREIPTWNDQAAFEEWAKSERYEMHQHPLHYLFIDPKTHAARMGWRAGLAFGLAATATDAPQLQHVLSVTQHPNVESSNREQSGIEAAIQQLGMSSSSKGPSRGGDEPLDPNRNNGPALQQAEARNVPPDHHVLEAIAAERKRQIAKGYDAAHDDKHIAGEIINSSWGALARVYAAQDRGMSGDVAGYTRYLIQAASQIVAEVERVSRATATEGSR